jgi:putative NADH-flavin reductase
VKLFVIGATGRTGRHVIAEALARKQSVTAIVRQSGSLEPCEGLRVISGDPLNADDLAPILPGHDAVITCLGQRSSTDARLLQDAAAATMTAMTRCGLRRYLVVSQGLLFPSSNPIITLLRVMLARHIADSIAMEHLVRTSETDWTIVRPPRLLEGGRPRGYKTRAGARPGGASAMQRCDLAAFLLDAVERREYLREIAGITSGRNS